MFKLSSVFAMALLVLVSCNSSTESDQEATIDTTSLDTMTTVAEAVVAYLPPVTENVVANVHMNKKHHEAKKAGKPTDAIDVEVDYETVTVGVFVAALADSGVVALDSSTIPAVKDTVTVSASKTVLNQDQKVIELGKRGQTSSMEVISDPTDPNTISEIVFKDKKHVDVYNVQAGMKAKDVRKLRRQMKHMVRKGKVFMYSDDSNIMYQMTATDAATKDSYTDAEVDDMTVDAIVWKNKKQAKKEMKKMMKAK